ncbi:site-specific DNA-methyltransferase [Pseudarthrobacter sp. SSS035]|uniref:site-specific DNA-methyltransferase n=1 Tax=Pseudarthrobacter sp. SSS035 TaxID=2931399 RepID=UPI00200F2832|nr:DNA methyltransferase [Pseudarthrobacter sp. SSS035]
MAHLDTLMAMIPDEKLRSEIQGQVSRLTAKASFGLVFEEHRPESVLLPGFEVTRGGKVVFKDGATPGVWTVLRLVDGLATIVRPGDKAQRSTAKVEDLVVIREFGDPIYPGLQSVGSVARGGDKPFHCVINAENFHAAEMLLYPYERKVDAIYLDPPYNTGAKDWKYNNDYVDGEDAYRHSKWLAFMERRLKLAKRLLNPSNSVLIVTIDEKEYLRLGLLLEQVFPEATIQMITSVIKPSGSTRSSEFSRVDEYVFFVMLGAAGPASTGSDMLRADDAAVAAPNITWHGMRRRGSNDWTRATRPNGFYPVFLSVEDNSFHSLGEPLKLEEDRHAVVPPAGTYAAWPLDPQGREGRWQISPARFMKQLAEGTLVVSSADRATETCSVSYLKSGDVKKIADGDVVVTGRGPDGRVLVEAGGRGLKRPKSVWAMDSHDASTYGTALLSKFIPDRKFPYPKSLYAVEDALRFFILHKKNAVVLDFFSGSGTTAHAVMRLNKQDGGRRRSILVTNNEVSVAEEKSLRLAGHEPGDGAWEALGIFEHVTLPRLMSAIAGRTPDGEPVKGDYKFVDEFPMSDGFEENMEFFKLTYEDNQLVRLGRKFHAIAPILWMRAGAEGERIDQLSEDGWALPKNGYYGVLTDVDQWEAFVDAVNGRDDIRCVFIVSDSQAEFEAINAQIDQGIDSVRLYSDYLQSFEINTRQG